MKLETDTTLTRYATAAARMSGEDVARIMKLTYRHAPDSDTAADALPFVIPACEGRPESEWLGIARRTVQSQKRNALRRKDRNAIESAVSLDALAAAGWEAAAVATESAAPRWEDIRPTLAAEPRAMLDALAADALNRAGQTTLFHSRPMVGPLREGMAVWQRPTVLVSALVTRPLDVSKKPLRATVLAAAIGDSGKLTETKRRKYRAVACEGWGRVSVAQGNATDVRTRTAAAMTYTDPARGRLAAAWTKDRDLMSNAHTVTLRRPMVGPLRDGEQRPMIAVGAVGHGSREILAAALTSDTDGKGQTRQNGRTAPIARKGPVSRSRKGVTMANTSSRWTGSATAASQVSLTKADRKGVDTAGWWIEDGDSFLTIADRPDRTRPLAAGQSHPDSADERAAAVLAAAWLDERRECARPILTDSGATCGCGGAAGPLDVSREEHVRSDGTVYGTAVFYRHPVNVCPTTAAGRGGVQRCACGRKRGQVIATAGGWAHAPR